MASLYKREKSKYWWIKYSLNGVEHCESTKCVKKFDAERLKKEKFIPLEVNAYNHRNVLPVKKSLKDCLIEFKDQVLIHSHDGIRRKTAGTLDRQQTNLKNFLAYVEEKNLTNFADITEETIRDYIQNHLIKKNEKKPNSVYKDVQIAQNFFQWAVKKFYCSVDPTANIRNPKPPPNLHPRFFDQEQVNKIFANAKEPYLSMFKLLYLTGLRIQELLNAEWRDISISRKTILIPIKEGNKAKRDTSVLLNASAIEIIERMEKSKGENILLFTNQLGNPYSQGKIASYAVRLYKSLKIPTEDPLHTWRHTCASHLVQKGISLYIVKEILRHHSIKESEIYAHLSNESVQNAIDILSA